MLNDTPLPTLADLVRMDWLVLESKQCIDESRRSIAQKIAQSGEDAVEQAQQARLLEEHKRRIEKRQMMREYLAKTSDL
jgi:hypothetical protein